MTGIATWNAADELFGSHQDDWRGTGEFLETMAVHLQGDLAIGYESYHITPGSHVKHDGSALMVIGMVRWLAHRHGAIMLPSQQPSARRLGLSQLTKLDWHRPTKGGHADDAAAHLATYLMKTNTLPDGLKRKLSEGMLWRLLSCTTVISG